MRFLPTDEQLAITGAVREALAKECSPEVLRGADDGARSARLWTALATLGVFGLTIPEAHGGLGLDQRDAVAAFTELGRAAVPGPLAETFAVAQVLARAGDPDDWLPRIADGSVIVTLGLGDAPLVEAADRADLLLLEHDGSLYTVPGGEVASTREESVDPNRRLSSVRWGPARATRLIGSDDLVSVARDHLLLASSAFLVGLAKQILDLTVRHVMLREQFGRQLGTFQAVQHRLADVAVGVEFAEPVVQRAGCSLVAGVPSAWRDVAMAKVFASDAAERAAYAGLQLHGAIGYTREHDLHLYAIRAWVLAVAHGDASAHRLRVADDLLSATPAPRFPAS
jgi:alkylation response protein AidB-like acyl-CoA dehydrogenase